MQEYWINVYEAQPLLQWQGCQQEFYIKNSKEAAIKEQSKGLLYRIHVKMKPVKKALKPKYEYHGTEKWMEI